MTEISFSEVLVYGVIITFLVIALFVLNRILRVSVGEKVKRTELPFGMSPTDLDKLKSSGTLTEEEMKQIRQAMGRRFIERARAEEEKKKIPANAELALRMAEGERAPDATKSTHPVPASAPPERRPPPLPEHLQGMLRKTDLELEEMRLAGFLSDEDIALIRSQRAEP